MDIVVVRGVTRLVGKRQGYRGLPIRDEIINCAVGGPATPCMASVWRPSPAELAALNDGGAIEVKIVGTLHPPILVGVIQNPEA